MTRDCYLSKHVAQSLSIEPSPAWAILTSYSLVQVSQIVEEPPGYPHSAAIDRERAWQQRLDC